MTKIARGFIRYWNSNEQYINLTVQQQGQSVAYSTRRNHPLQDVKKLFLLDYNVLIGTLFYWPVFQLGKCIPGKWQIPEKTGRRDFVGQRYHSGVDAGVGHRYSGGFQ